MKPGIIVAAVIGILLGAGGYWLVAPHPAAPPHHPKYPPPNAPVVVRGGSLEFRSPKQWAQTGNGYETSGVDLTGVSIDGVSTSKTGITAIDESAGESTNPANPLQTNWSIVLILRDQNGDDPSGPDDQKPQLKVCSDSGCSGAGSISGSNLYLVADANGSFMDVNVKRDNQYLIRYNLNTSCGGTTGEHTKCNHVKKVNITGIYSWDSGDGASTSTLWCLAGQCDFGVGQ